MKRWLPVLLLGAAFLGNFIERAYHARFLASWQPGILYPLPNALSICEFLSLPLSLVVAWICWKPEPPHGIPSRYRRIAGNCTGLLTLAIWLMFLYQGLLAAWLTATPEPDVRRLVQRSATMFNDAALALCVGGLLTLWLKGARMPKKGSE
jgi:hypothetical protein